MFASSPSIRDLEKLMNEELAKIKEWCDLNKLSINIKKTKYMIVKFPKKKPGNTNIKLPNNDGSSDIIEKIGTQCVHVSAIWKFNDHVGKKAMQASRTKDICVLSP